MSARGKIPPADELVYLPRPSWAPAFFALGAALVVCGLFIAEYMVPGWAYCAIGAVVALAALRKMIAGAVQGYRALPERQDAPGAALPVETIAPPAR